MNDTAQLRPKLARLKMSGVLDNIDYHIEKARNEKLSYSDFLLNLLQDEIERRDQKQLNIMLKKSGMDMGKTLESFDFGFNTGIHQPTVRELATCHFIDKKENLFFLGPSGVGKSFLAQAVGHEAVRKGYEVLFQNTFSTLKFLNAGRADGSYEKKLKNLCRVDLLILDDFGLNDLSVLQQEDLYALICGRYEKHPFIITSNRDITEWASIFTNPLISSAALDRLVDGAIKIIIEGKSFRLNNFIKKNSSKILSKELT